MLTKLTHLVTCREASRLLSQRLDRPLPFGERVKLRLHLLACDACAGLDRQFALLRAAMRRYRE
jgi:hypothetical protein